MASFDAGKILADMYPARLEHAAVTIAAGMALRDGYNTEALATMAVKLAKEVLKQCDQEANRHE